MTVGGSDPWTNIRYSSTSASGWAEFTFSVNSDNTDVLGKVFIVHNNAGGRVSCGPLGALTTTTSTTKVPYANGGYTVFTASLTELGSSGVSGEVTVFLTPTGLHGIGNAAGLEGNLQAAPGGDCTATNGCGVHVHSGTECTNSGTQGGHYFATAPDPWATVRYSSTDATGAVSFTFLVLSVIFHIGKIVSGKIWKNL